MPSKLVTSAVERKHFEQLKKVFELETHCREKRLEFVVNRQPVIMSQVKTQFTDLPLDLTLQVAFKNIFSNVTNVVTTQEEYD